MGADENTRPESSTPAPFFRARQHQTEYAGPGRETPPPADVDEVLLGYFGPDDASHPRGGDMWRAAQLAIDDANRRGGYRGKPFRLVAGWSENPWGTGVAKLTRMVYCDKVWAIIGGIDGPTTHLAEQVVTKARLTLLSPASTDKTVNLINVPWMFSLVAGDHLQAPLLADAIEQHVGNEPFLLVSANDHDSHLFTVELRKCFAKRRMVPGYHFEYERGTRNLAELVARIVRSKAGTVVLIAGAHDGARLTSALRDNGFEGAVFGGPTMGRNEFVQQADEAAEGVVFPLLYDPFCGSSQASGRFVETFQRSFGRTPDYAAAHTYDAVQLLVAAIGKAGLNRARIRDAVRELSPWKGVTGTVKWNLLGANSQIVRLGTIKGGRVVFAAQ